MCVVRYAKLHYVRFLTRLYSTFLNDYIHYNDNDIETITIFHYLKTNQRHLEIYFLESLTAENNNCYLQYLLSRGKKADLGTRLHSVQNSFYITKVTSHLVHTSMYT